MNLFSSSLLAFLPGHSLLVSTHPWSLLLLLPAQGPRRFNWPLARECASSNVHSTGCARANSPRNARKSHFRYMFDHVDRRKDGAAGMIASVPTSSQAQTCILDTQGRRALCVSWDRSMGEGPLS